LDAARRQTEVIDIGGGTMPVNMDPAKKHRRRPTEASVRANTPQEAQTRKPFGEETEEDRLKALADAEKKNLWDATEVIDMDTF
jgi:hypothetical protein